MHVQNITKEIQLKQKSIKNSSACLYVTMGNRERFLKVYANLPLNLRKETILVLDERGPITWEVAYLEVINHTKISELILKQLAEIEII